MSTWAETSQHSVPEKLRRPISHAYSVTRKLTCLSSRAHFLKMSIWADTFQHLSNEMSIWDETSQHNWTRMLRCLSSSAHLVTKMWRCLSSNAHFGKMSIWLAQNVEMSQLIRSFRCKNVYKSKLKCSFWENEHLSSDISTFFNEVSIWDETSRFFCPECWDVSAQRLTSLQKCGDN